MSNYFVWDPAKLSVGVKAMDEEHVYLIGLMNKLYDKHEKKAPKAELSSVIKELYTFTQKHFSDEEKYFSSLAGYEKAEIHKKLHADLLKKLEGFAKEFEAGPGVIKPDFFQFLKVWLSAHIMSIDGAYAKVANKVA